ncbi:PstA family ABC transporter permease [Alkaliphilus peptidifermentans]|uniref:Phosphate ABC transporter membrane protein 2, PhoT family n=1 Tax=Alkaliphilus peptidifermentans DSM 18978 TaxID=1120976 RepID=A0A1G5CF16_9FIRM|nr:ABC transporter permease subunit [Alkaliphilus peptidifermentans]SCY00878.1 phosphate ABC transporter membrane protein 2, PhoT family [Alkaliphilus peptidifermentans DSM 18978]
MRRYAQGYFIKLWCVLSGIIVLSLISYIIIYIIINGISVLNLSFIFDSPKGMPLGSEGGIYPAIIGSLYLTLIACFFASILAISTAIYLLFYCNSIKISNLIHLVIGCIAGIPSIIIGMFGYTLLVYQLRLGRSLIAGGITLGIMIFPVIEVKVERIISEIDSYIISSSYALGVSKTYTFFRLVLPACKRDIIASIALAGSYAMGATAPIILTSAVMFAPTPKSLTSPVMALPYHLYLLISESISIQNAYATTFVLISILLTINIIASLVAKTGR